MKRPKTGKITIVLLAFCALLLVLSLSKDVSATISQSVHLPFSYKPTAPCWQCTTREFYQVGAWHYGGNYELSKGNYLEAIGLYNKVLENDPNNVEVLVSDGYALAEIDRYDEASSLLDKALTIYPHNAYAILIKEDVLYGKAASLTNQGKYQEAIIYYDEIIKMDPKFVFTGTDLKVIQEYSK